MQSSAREWIQAGLEILVSDGAPSLTIENLLKKMNLTRGSFYHHFNGRDDYVTKLIEFWKSSMATGIIEKLTTDLSPREKYLTLEKTLATSFSPEQEVAIRSWAVHSQTIRLVVEEVDQLRTESLVEILLSAGLNRTASRRIGRMIYAAFIGSLYIQPVAKNKEQRQWNDLLWELLMNEK